MVYLVCIKTPAGETKTFPVDWPRPLLDHEIHAPLRIGLSHALKWVDDHVSWKQDDPVFPRILVPFHGEENWEIQMHADDRVCKLCEKVSVEEELPLEIIPHGSVIIHKRGGFAVLSCAECNGLLFPDETHVESRDCSIYEREIAGKER